MYTDPNWLLSTVVQSAAVFVAIVAGFIISRLLALSAERSGLQTRVRDMRLQVAIKKQNLETLEKRLLDWDAEIFLENSEVLDEIIESEGEVSLAETIKRVTGLKRSEDELRSYWGEAIKTTKSAFRLFKEKFDELQESEDITEAVDNLLTNLGLNLSSYRLKIYHQVFGHIFSDYEKRRNPFRAMVNSVGTFGIPDIRTENEINRYGILQRDIETLKRDKSSLETQLSDLEIQLKQLGQPKGVILGIIFLAYFSLTSIVVPVFLLPFAAEQFTPTYKWMIFVLFISGLLFFFIYLWILFRQLAETPDSDNSSKKRGS